MKRVFFVVLWFLAIAGQDAGAQIGRGSWELSAACNLGSMSSSYESTGGGQTHSGSSEAQGYFALDFRVGGYPADGFSIEPEVYMLAVENESPAFNFGANLAYTFDIQESIIKPFVIAGYGIGNGAPIMQRLLGRSSDKLDIPVLRVGGGIKVFVSKSVALKMEYRYERYSQEKTTTIYTYSYTTNSTANYHNVLFGFSVFFPGGN